ncbi:MULTISPECIES: hypothetical protein [unclassified Imperialibacter]|uniref:hypothetical protein n=1 Tax=unclassified Imperialibacter TaxID=2629706 RepID=UPI0012572111|nr:MULTISPECIES: hypothetical protein [unclassified Imperialibacter]CAD5254342.1 hypothetical protein IMPERIA75_200102 [Imperialibacter sp. 75]CAD5262786.1 hypothetical protein IMPERIA89_290102 [Imperialibacter sp. 89]VVT35315.1 hypothetical protein IMPR6_80101 [Imperialibacter sp. EC-SDR9]
MKLTPKQEKELAEIVLSNSIDWGNFEEVQVANAGKEYSRLIHKPTGLFFEIFHDVLFETVHQNMGGWHVYFTPGNDYSAYSSFELIKGWDNVKIIFKSWIALLQDEIQASEFLDDIQEFASTPTEKFDFSEDVLLNEDEVSQLTTELLLLKQKIESLQGENQMVVQSLEAKIDYLISRVDKKYPKIDWINLAMGTIVSMFSSEASDFIKSHPELFDHIKFFFHLVSNGKFLK